MIKLTVRQHRRSYQLQLLLAVTGFGLLYWVMASVRDVLISGNENLFEKIFMPSPFVFWMRLLVVCVIALFSVLAYHIKKKNYVTDALGKLKNLNARVVKAGLGTVLFYWAVEAFRDYFVFSKGSFISQLVTPSPMDFWMRLLVISILALFAVYVYLLLQTEKESIEDMQQENSQMMQLVEEKTASLVIANKRLEHEIREREEAENNIREINKLLLMLSRGNKSLVKATDEFSLVSKVSEIIINTGEYQAVWIGYVHEGSLRTVSQAGVIEISHSEENILLEEFIYNPAQEAVQRQQPVFLNIDDVEFSGYCDYCNVAPGITSLVSLPVSNEGNKIGVITVFTNRRNAFAGKELSIIMEMVEDLAFGISVLRSRGEQKLMEKNLHENEMKYRTLTENIHAGIFRTSADMEERFIEVNSSYIKIFGFENRDELFRSSASRMYADLDEQSRIRKKLMNRGEIHDDEVQFRRKDGSIIWCSMSATAVRDTSGRVIYIDGVLEDITERKLAATKLRRSEEKYRLIVENTGEGIVQVDLNENFTYANRACEAIFGVPVNALIGKNFSEFVDEDTFNLLRTQTRNRVKGMVDSYEIEIKRPSGEHRNVLITATPQIGEDGSIVAGFGIIRDITDRKRVEVELVRVNRALKTLSAGNMALVRASEESELLKDVCNILVEVGGYQLAWTGFFSQGKGIIGIEDFVSSGKCSERFDTMKDSFDIDSVQNNPLKTVYQTQKPVIIRSDSPFYENGWWNELFASAGCSVCILLPLCDGDTVLGILSIYSNDDDAFDDEELRLLEELSNDLAFGIVVQRNRVKHAIVSKEKDTIHAQLIQAQKMEAVGILAGGIAHDFNNILTAIQVSSEIALMEVDEDCTLHEDLTEIQKLTNKASDFIRQLLLFSRKHPMEMKKINLNDSITNLKKMLNRIIGEDITVRSMFQDDLWSVKADLGTMEQVIMNLAVNARDAMPQGGTVQLKTENVSCDSEKTRNHRDVSPGKWVCLSVSDTGIGMDAETIEHIFEPFFSTKGAGKGTGLGLSVVYGIVKQHGGWIDIDSTPGMGTCFSIYLPALEQSADTCTDKPKAARAVSGGGKRILFIEDEEKVRESTSYGLHRNGYRVFSAATAREAREVFIQEKGDFHLILSDVVLPDKSGLELVEELLMLNPELNVLISSGYTDHKVRWSEISERGYRFLEKPYALGELLQLVQEVAA